MCSANSEVSSTLHALFLDFNTCMKIKLFTGERFQTVLNENFLEIWLQKAHGPYEVSSELMLLDLT